MSPNLRRKRCSRCRLGVVVSCKQFCGGPPTPQAMPLTIAPQSTEKLRYILGLTGVLPQRFLPFDHTKGLGRVRPKPRINK